MTIHVDRGVELDTGRDPAGVRELLDRLRASGVVIDALTTAPMLERNHVVLLAHPWDSLRSELEREAFPYRERGFVTLPLDPFDVGLEAALQVLRAAGVEVHAVLPPLRGRHGITLAVADGEEARAVLAQDPVVTSSGRDVER